MNNKKNSGTKKTSKGIIVSLIIILILSAYALTVFLTTKSVIEIQPLGSRTSEQEITMNSILNQKFPERKSIALKGNPFDINTDDIYIKAKSAIIVDTATGTVLYEKNADQQIPPASMTKLVEMYVVYEAIENGEATMDDIVPLPPESWEENIPWDASRMHLAKGQKVTLRELLLGLAIASGNDASIAVANYICGNMDDFVARMNAVVDGMGLKKTHFVESSGYSEENLTTAREFATFARQYVNRFPESLQDFHAQPVLRYPQKKNMPEGKFQTVFTQYNTNKLLDSLIGCDGLKTGFIYESGYNISVTAERNGTRYLSVTMGGPGNNTNEGNQYRVKDNYELFTFAFNNFADYHAPQGDKAHEYTVGIFGGAEKAVKLVPALDETFTVPMMTDSPTGSAASVQVNVTVPKYLYGKVECGKQYGEISYTLNGQTLRTLPLVADRTVEQGNFFTKLVGKTGAIAVDMLKGKQPVY